MNLFNAHTQWATRPTDERFATLADLHAAVEARDTASFDGTADMRKTLFDVGPQRMALVSSTPGDKAVTLTQYAADSFARRLGVTTDLLAKLDPEVASTVMNNRLDRHLRREQGDPKARLLVANANGDGTVVRALHGSGYARFSQRVWDSDITGRLLRELPEGWRNPVAYKDGVWGAELVPSGLYASDRDMFAFLIDGGDQLDLGRRDQFNAGFIVWNSEVGARSFGLMRFFFRVVCGNNIVWDAGDVETLTIRHVGDARGSAVRILSRFLESCKAGAGRDAFASVVKLARDTVLAPVDTLREGESVEKLRKRGFSKTDTVEALRHIRAEEEAPTGSAWDWVQGYTAVARAKQNADARLQLERDAAKLLPAIAR